MKILIIEDDKATAEFVAKGLQDAGYQTGHAEDGVRGLEMAKSGTFDLAVVDIMLPGLDGFAVIRGIREAGIEMPLLVLSAKDSVESKISGLDCGGDDYLAKPFSFGELLARIQALLRRAVRAAEPTRLTVGDLTMDLLRREVRRAGEVLDLQPLEFQLLEYLMRNHGRVVTRTTILEHVWKYNFDTQTNIVEAAVFRLREKIDKPFEKKMLRTVRGFGYVLE